MQKTHFAIAALLAVSSAPATAQFQGFGSVTQGAEGCPGFLRYQVTNLNDSGPGSFRDGVSGGCRYITFTVGGTITLTSTLLIPYSYLTIDGASAPAPGITLNTPRIRTAIESRASMGAAHDIIIHNIRIQGAGGDQESADNLELDGMVAPVYNIVLDHITAVSASDGNFDVYGDVSDVTISNNFVRDTIKTSHFSRETPPNRERISIYGNVYARNNERQLRMRYDNHELDIVNNVVYGWGWIGGGAAGLDIPSDPGYFARINVENNYYHYVPGRPAGDADDAVKFDSGSFPGDIYFGGNVFPSGEADAVSTAGRTPIPSYAQVTKHAANQLGDAVVPCAGMKYPTAEEAQLLRDVSLAIGGAGAACKRPSPPTDLRVN